MVITAKGVLKLSKNESNGNAHEWKPILFENLNSQKNSCRWILCIGQSDARWKVDKIRWASKGFYVAWISNSDIGRNTNFINSPYRPWESIENCPLLPLTQVFNASKQHLKPVFRLMFILIQCSVQQQLLLWFEQRQTPAHLLFLWGDWLLPLASFYMCSIYLIDRVIKVSQTSQHIWVINSGP